jgi:GDP-4-dehydro-6-deoxy-D-mannose reductase
VNVARVFNPIGPGMSHAQAFGEFADQLASKGADPLPLVVGNLGIRRDFIDVRDVSRAMVAVAIRGRSRLVYHVGTGESRRVGDGLDLLIKLSGRSVRVCVDPRRSHRKAPLDSRADIGRIVNHTGWTPTIPFEQSLADLWIEMKISQDQPSVGVPAPLPLTA